MVFKKLKKIFAWNWSSFLIVFLKALCLFSKVPFGVDKTDKMKWKVIRWWWNTHTHTHTPHTHHTHTHTDTQSGNVFVSQRSLTFKSETNFLK